MWLPEVPSDHQEGDSARSTITMNSETLVKEASTPKRCQGRDRIDVELVDRINRGTSFRHVLPFILCGRPALNLRVIMRRLSAALTVARPRRRNREAIDIPEPRRHAKSQEQDQQERGCADPRSSCHPISAPTTVAATNSDSTRKPRLIACPRPLSVRSPSALRSAVLLAGFALRLKVARQFGEARLQFIGFVRPSCI